MKFSWALMAGLTCTALARSEQKTPNVVIFLADDMGFSDVGCYGSEIQTPVLDKLAEDGLRYTQFYNAARCWPTRAGLLTGYYPHEIGRDKAPGIPGGTKGVRPAWAPLVTQYLKQAGYRCYHSGKWHIDGQPEKNGFDQTYYLEDCNRYFTVQEHYENGVELHPVEKPGTYYSTTEVANRAIKYLKDHQQNCADNPFFAYVAFTSPHFPLQAPPEDIKKVGDRYAVGWDKIREERWKRIQQLGIISGELSDHEPFVGPATNAKLLAQALKQLGSDEVTNSVPWDSLTPSQQKFQQTKMTIHAAMVERMDVEIGRVLEQIDAMGATEDTLILFLSDNGASSEIMIRGDGNDPSAAPGSAGSYLCLGPGWANAANTPFRRYKTYAQEGGTHTPFIVRWPQGIHEKGVFRHDVGHIIDIVPTLLDIAGISTTGISNQPEMPGQSLLPSFTKDTGTARGLWFFHGNGKKAYRDGDWKIVADQYNKSWSLYDLSKDETECHDLASKYPERVKDLSDKWDAQLETFKKTVKNK